MKHLHLTYIIGLTGLMFSCGVQKEPDFLTIKKLAELEKRPQLKAKQVKITCKVIEADGSVSALPSVITRIGQKATVEVYREYKYPLTYDLIETPKSLKDRDGDMFPVTPAKPKTFGTEKIGRTLDVTPVIRGPFIEVRGKLTVRTVEPNNFGAGEAYSVISTMNRGSEIIVTENRAVAPEFKEITNTVLVCGTPDTEHIMYLKDRRKLVFKMTIVK